MREPTLPAGVLSVSALARSVRDILETRFPLLWVSGEISNYMRARSGHSYFVLKDELSQVRCVMFRHRSQYMDWMPADGMQVEVQALVTLYEARGEFQLNIESMRRAGVGVLYERFLKLRDQLERQGLFAAELKRPLPTYPRTIGVITSLKAAALRDVLTTLRRRNPSINVIVYPVQVQGDVAAGEVAKALEVAGHRAECDVIILARGGGSIEDLWAFNGEAVARAIVACPIPVISGVGHETDTTLADLVADLRAATPTAAAEHATQGWFQAAAEIADIDAALSRAIQYHIAREQQGLDHLSLLLVNPATRLARASDRLALLGSQLAASLAQSLRKHRDRLNRSALGLGRTSPRTDRHRGHIELLKQRLSTTIRDQHQKRLGALDKLATALTHLNPEATLARGFSIIRDADGKLITDAASLHSGQTVSLYLAHGGAQASILTTDSNHRPIVT